MTEIADDNVGMPHDPVAQQRAVEYMRAALAFRQRQAERATVTRRTFQAASVFIPTAPSDDEDNLAVGMMPDVVAILAARGVRFDG